MTKAFEEGKLAASQGTDRTACPYDILTVEYDEWQEGFFYVQETDEDGELKEN